MTKNDDTIQRVEKFIDQLLTGLIELEPRSLQHTITIGEGKRSHYQNLREHISRLIHEYQKCDEAEKQTVAIDIFQCMSYAYPNNLVKRGDHFTESFMWYQEHYPKLKTRYDELKETHQKLADDFIFIQGKNKQLEELLERIVPKGKDIER